MFDICEQCHHSMSMHIGPVDMGGGNIEPVGCMHNVVTKDGPDLCQCLNYDKDGDWDE